ncbi:MAG TPA: hypothetical protein VGX03_22985 [Candidatus Binatia bacterium]|nr:hypothetical protein [Candidatus Binatia bacterium]
MFLSHNACGQLRGLEHGVVAVARYHTDAAHKLFRELLVDLVEQHVSGAQTNGQLAQSPGEVVNRPRQRHISTLSVVGFVE